MIVKLKRKLQQKFNLRLKNNIENSITKFFISILLREILSPKSTSCLTS